MTFTLLYNDITGHANDKRCVIELRGKCNAQIKHCVRAHILILLKSYNRVIPLQSSVILGNLIPQFLRIKIQPAWKGDPTCRRMIVRLIGRKVCAIVDRRGKHKKV